MPVTVVRCSNPGCRAEAEAKIAAPWKDGAFSELKTYAYSCPEHAEVLIAYAEKRPKPGHYSPGETVGPIATYELATI
ncbi:MAG: hypothetical protein P4L84_28425 [Isosphaeraceae bacterium]|nr:hypothetical protein [Isosphaeraceae bacterium]